MVKLGSFTFFLHSHIPKEEYRPGWVEERIRENAGHFKDLVKGILSRNRKELGHLGIVTAPFDSELLGHWWFEGPRWLYYVLKWIDMDPEMGVTTGDHRKKYARMMR